METNRYCPIKSFLPRKFALYSKAKKKTKTKQNIKLKKEEERKTVRRRGYKRTAFLSALI